MGLALLACRAPVPVPRDALRVALPSALSSLDPHFSNNLGAFTVLGNVYEPLIHADPGMGLRPGLATNWYNPDPLTWDFDLRPGVRFHSGKRFEAKDAVFSIERVLRSSALDVTYYLGDVASAEALGPHRLRIHLRRRSAALLNKLGHVFMVPEGSTNAFLDHAEDGSGPYRVESWERGKSVELVARKADRRGRPPLSRVSVRMNVPPREIVQELGAGRDDMALVGLRRLEPGIEARFALHRRGSLQVKYLGLDLTSRLAACCPGQRNPFADHRVREALHLALDRNRIAAALPSRAMAANQLVPRQVFGFNPRLPEAGPDRERSKALLREAGFPNGFSTTLHTRQILGEAAEPVRRELQEVGIELKVVVLPDPEYFPGLQKHAFSLWLDRWSCTTGDAGELFENALHSSQPARGLGTFNESAYVNPTLDAAIEKMLVIEDLVKRRVALEKLMESVMRELVWIPLYTDEEMWAVDRAFVWRPGSDYWLRLADVSAAVAGSTSSH